MSESVSNGRSDPSLDEARFFVYPRSAKLRPRALFMALWPLRGEKGSATPSLRLGGRREEGGRG